MRTIPQRGRIFGSPPVDAVSWQIILRLRMRSFGSTNVVAVAEKEQLQQQLLLQQQEPAAEVAKETTTETFQLRNRWARVGRW